MNNLQNFVGSSKEFNGFTFNGLFNMPKEHFFRLFEHYINTGENLLDDYADIKKLQWRETGDFNCKNILDLNEFSLVIYQLNHEILKDFFQPEYLNACEKLAISWYDNYLEFKGYKVKRAKASLFISKEKIRDQVFKLHGNKCLKCNSEKKISLDHIIPVRLGGEDSIHNLQPLCASCNSQKGTTIADYRRIKTDGYAL